MPSNEQQTIMPDLIETSTHKTAAIWFSKTCVGFGSITSFNVSRELLLLLNEDRLLDFLRDVLDAFFCFALILTLQTITVLS